jgi:hypothetical protein
MFDSAWRCTEEYTPDGKRLVRRERSLGNIVVKGVVVIVFIAAVVLLVVTGHAVASLPVSFASGVLRWLGK